MYYLPPLPDESDIKDSRIPLNNKGWNILLSGIQEQNSSSAYLIDGDESTVFKGNVRKLPADLVIDFKGEIKTLKGFSYIPGKMKNAGHIEEYALYTSMEEGNWGGPVVRGRFGNIVNNPVEQFVSFDARKAVFVRLQILKTSSDTVTIPEIIWY